MYHLHSLFCPEIFAKFLSYNYTLSEGLVQVNVQCFERCPGLIARGPAQLPFNITFVLMLDLPVETFCQANISFVRYLRIRV